MFVTAIPEVVHRECELIAHVLFRRGNNHTAVHLILQRRAAFDCETICGNVGDLKRGGNFQVGAPVFRRLVRKPKNQVDGEVIETTLSNRFNYIPGRLGTMDPVHELQIVFEERLDTDTQPIYTQSPDRCQVVGRYVFGFTSSVVSCTWEQSKLSLSVSMITPRSSGWSREGVPPPK